MSLEQENTYKHTFNVYGFICCPLLLKIKLNRMSCHSLILEIISIDIKLLSHLARTSL